MFSGFLVNTWIAATIVAVVAGVIGFFVVLRQAAFVTHALPQGAFAGAAGAALIGANTILGLGVFSALGAVGIASFGRRARQDVATALGFVGMLALGSLFLSFHSAYAEEVYALLFGDVLGVSRGELPPIAALGAACLVASACLYRPLLFASTLGDVAESRGVRPGALEVAFLLLVALASSMTVPVVGSFLMFSLVVAPAAAARSLTARPLMAVALGVAGALVTAWSAIASSYVSNLPVGFFVGAYGAALYGAARLAAYLLDRQRATVQHRRAR